jgi:hypothetical protein
MPLGAVRFELHEIITKQSLLAIGDKVDHVFLIIVNSRLYIFNIVETVKAYFEFTLAVNKFGSFFASHKVYLSFRHANESVGLVFEMFVERHKLFKDHILKV